MRDAIADATFCKPLVMQRETAMDMSQVHNIAKRLIDTHGLKAEVEAAEKLQDAEKAGDNEKIELWRKVRAAVQEMKPAHES